MDDYDDIVKKLMEAKILADEERKKREALQAIEDEKRKSKTVELFAAITNELRKVESSVVKNGAKASLDHISGAFESKSALNLRAGGHFSSILFKRTGERDISVTVQFAGESSLPATPVTDFDQAQGLILEVLTKSLMS